MVGCLCTKALSVLSSTSSGFCSRYVGLFGDPRWLLFGVGVALRCLLNQTYALVMHPYRFYGRDIIIGQEYDYYEGSQIDPWCGPAPVDIEGSSAVLELSAEPKPGPHTLVFGSPSTLRRSCLTKSWADTLFQSIVPQGELAGKKGFLLVKLDAGQCVHLRVLGRKPCCSEFACKR